MLASCAGIDDPYEAPEHPEITLDINDSQGRRQSPEAMARIILAYLEVCLLLLSLQPSHPFASRFLLLFRSSYRKIPGSHILW